MGADFYLNPPKDQCKDCKQWYEWLNKQGICTYCDNTRLRDENKKLKAEVERLKAALRHAMVCDFPESIRFRCEGCVKAEKALTGGRKK